VSLGQTLALGLIFTAISIVRSFTLRRVFEAIRVRSADRARVARNARPQRRPLTAISAESPTPRRPAA